MEEGLLGCSRENGQVSIVPKCRKVSLRDYEEMKNPQAIV
jgi:hypothetical protein